MHLIHVVVVRGRPNVTLIVSAETETGPKVYALHSAEIESQPKVYVDFWPKPKPKV